MEVEADRQQHLGSAPRRRGSVTPVRIEGALGLDGAWALDRYLDADAGVTEAGDLLDRVWVRPMGSAVAQLGVGMAAVLAAHRWPDDLVVVPVPSSNDTAEVLAHVVACVLERDVKRLLRTRRGRRSGPVRRRFGVVPRYMGDHVLLVDDVVRSGDTLAACAQALRRRGVLGVWAISAAIEPVVSPTRMLELVPCGQKELDAVVPVMFDGRALDVRVIVSATGPATGPAGPAPLFDQEARATAEFAGEVVRDPPARPRVVRDRSPLDGTLWDAPQWEAPQWPEPAA